MNGTTPDLHVNMTSWHRVGPIVIFPVPKAGGTTVRKAALNACPNRRPRVLLADEQATLDGAIEHLLRMDFILFQETLDTDIKDKRRKFGWLLPTRELSRNAMLRTPESANYSPQTPQKIKNLANLDYALIEAALTFRREVNTRPQRRNLTDHISACATANRPARGTG